MRNGVEPAVSKDERGVCLVEDPQMVNQSDGVNPEKVHRQCLTFFVNITPFLDLLQPFSRGHDQIRPRALQLAALILLPDAQHCIAGRFSAVSQKDGMKQVTH